MINHISDDLHHIHLLALTNFPLAILVICDVTYIIISLEYARRAFCERRMVAWDGLSYYCKERPMRSRTNLLVSRSSTRCRPPRRELYVACQLKGTSSTVLQHAHIMPLRSRAFARQKLCLDLYVFNLSEQARRCDRHVLPPPASNKQHQQHRRLTRSAITAPA